MATTTRTQQSIDDQIARLERELLELKRERNELSSISTLPPEILCEILLRATSYPQDTKSLIDLPDRLRTKRVIRTLCHVSHSWRSAALGCPVLWAEIDVGITTDARQVEFMAKHAHPHAISLHIDAVTRMSPALQYTQLNALDVVAQILSERDCFGKLVFKGGIQFLLDLLAVTRPAALQALQIAVSDGRFLGYSATGASIAQHPVFVDEMRGLRTLSLVGCAIPLTSPILVQSPHLISLSLATPKDSSKTHVLNILKATPQLQQLQLDFRGLLLPTQTTLDPVHLPCLSRLNLKGDTDSILDTVSYLRLSAKELGLNVFCALERDILAGQAGSVLFRALGQARCPVGIVHTTLRSAQPFSPHILQLECTPFVNMEGGCCVTMGNEDAGPEGVPMQDSSKPPPIATAVAAVVFYDLSRSHVIDPAKWNPLMLANHPQDLQTSVGWSMDELQAFGLRGDRDYPDSLWQLLSQCPKISELDVASSHLLKLLPLLFADNGTFPFPSLCRIDVVGEVSTGTPGSLSAGKGCESLLERFLQALRRRQTTASEYGVRREWMLEQLWFRDCRDPPDQQLVHLARAQGLVRRVF